MDLFTTFILFIHRFCGLCALFARSNGQEEGAKEQEVEKYDLLNHLCRAVHT